MKKIKLFTYAILVLLVTLSSCSKENDSVAQDLEAEIQTNNKSFNAFPVEITMNDYFIMFMEHAKGELHGFSEFGALNETEWFIRDASGHTQYYLADAQTETLYATEEFSGQIDYPTELENDAYVICSNSGYYTVDGHSFCCTNFVDVGLIYSTLNVTCGGLSPESLTFPTGILSVGIACAAGAQSVSGAAPCPE